VVYTLQWNIENIIAPIIVGVFLLIFEVLFEHFVECLKKPHFFVDFCVFFLYPEQANRQWSKLECVYSN